MIKAEALVATGMPGAYKVFLFLLVQYFYGMDALGDIASWLSLAQIIGCFTAIGWSTLMLVRVAKAVTVKEQVETLYRLLVMSVITLVASIFLIMAGGLFLNCFLKRYKLLHCLSAGLYIKSRGII